MKTVTTFILIMFCFKNCFSQTVDTIRVYDYFKPSDRWKLQINSNKTFALYGSNFSLEEDTIATGVYKTTDTTIQFLYDTSLLKSKYLATEQLRQFSNIPFILCGDT